MLAAIREYCIAFASVLAVLGMAHMLLGRLMGETHAVYILYVSAVSGIAGPIKLAIERRRQDVQKR